jgi:hypothetical protein
MPTGALGDGGLGLDLGVVETGELLRLARAVEAVMWGMPAVSMAAFRRSLAEDLGAAAGDVVYLSDVMVPRHEFLTANNQTPYVFAVLDLHDGPVVLDVPPATDRVAFFGSGIDSWEVPLVDVGPTSQDGGRGGRYLFQPPGDESGPAPDGFFAVRCPTYYVHVCLRPIAVGDGTLADAVGYSQQLRVYPLADAQTPGATRYVDAFPHAWHTLPPFDLDYFRLLAEVVVGRRVV